MRIAKKNCACWWYIGNNIQNMGESAEPCRYPSELDYEQGVAVGKELGIKVFCGVELSYKATDYLIYGLDKSWYLSHPGIMDMDKHEELLLMQRSAATIHRYCAKLTFAYTGTMAFPCFFGEALANICGLCYTF